MCVRFKSLSPGHLSYLCHITRCPIRAQQKGPVSARLTASKTDGRTEGASWEMDGRPGTPPPTPRAAPRRGLVEVLTLICLVSSLSGLEGVMGAGGGEREAGEAQRECV